MEFRPTGLRATFSLLMVAFATELAGCAHAEVDEPPGSGSGYGGVADATADTGAGTTDAGTAPVDATADVPADGGATPDSRDSGSTTTDASDSGSTSDAATDIGSTATDAGDSGGPSQTVFVSRVGNGTTALTTALTAPVFIEERTIATGALVRTLSLPTVNAGTQNAFSLVGGATTEGNIHRSADGRYVMVAGYALAPGSADPRSTSPATLRRVIARVDAAGNVDTSTLVEAFSTPRSAASVDGAGFWVTGVAGASTSNGGLHYVLFGSTGTKTTIFSTPSTVRQADIFFGQLYVGLVGSTPNTDGIGAVGTGLPTTAATVTTLPGFSAANAPDVAGYAFVKTGAGASADRIYAAHDVNDTAGVSVYRYSIAGGTVTYESAFQPVFAGVDAGSRGLAVVQSGGAFTILATTNEDVRVGGNRLVKVIDDGSTMTPTVDQVSTTGSAEARYRGVALAPVP